MVYRFQVKRNLKSLLLPAIALVLVAAAVAIIIFYHPLLGVLALAVAAFIGYHLVKFFVNTVKSHVKTSDEGLVCATAIGGQSSVGWDALTHAGWYTTESGYRELFVYAEARDRLLTIPPQYDGMEELAEEVRSRTNLKMLELSGDEIDGVADALRAYVVPESEIIDDEDEEESH